MNLKCIISIPSRPVRPEGCTRVHDRPKRRGAIVAPSTCHRRKFAERINRVLIAPFWRRDRVASWTRFRPEARSRAFNFSHSERTQQERYFGESRSPYRSRPVWPLRSGFTRNVVVVRIACGLKLRVFQVTECDGRRDKHNFASTLCGERVGRVYLTYCNSTSTTIVESRMFSRPLEIISRPVSRHVGSKIKNNCTYRRLKVDDDEGIVRRKNVR